MLKDYSEIDQEILQAILSVSGVPTCNSICKEGGGPLAHNSKVISKHLKNNPGLQTALENKGVEFVENCDRVTFDNAVISNKFGGIKGIVRAAIEKRIDGYILEAINSCESIPTAYNLNRRSGGSLEYGTALISKHIGKNPVLQESLEKRGLEFVQNCDRETFDRLFTSKKWTQATGKLREEIDRRIDKHIFEAILTFSGVPAAGNLSKDGNGPLEYGVHLILERIGGNPDLQEALERKGVEFVQTCDRKTFDDSVTSTQWIKVTEKVREAINRRLDRHILEAIPSFEGVPCANNLSKENDGPLKYSVTAILERLEENSALQEALEKRGMEFVESCSRAIFDESLISRQWNQVTEKVREAINRRLDRHILEAISSLEGVLTANNLCKENGGPLMYGSRVVLERLKENPALAEALEKRSLEFAQTCNRKVFDESVSSWLQNVATGKVRGAIFKRLDNYILEAIFSFEGIPTGSKLCKERGGLLEYSLNSILQRLEQNPELRRAFYLKRGLTEDRINALEMESEVHSPAEIESFRRRLSNTRIFREALGILKQFRELFEGKKSLELSFYPEPLGRAAQMLGVMPQACYVRGHGLKRPDFRFEQQENLDTVAILQLCHRLENESLVHAFNEANRILSENGVLMVSFPEDYTRTALFETQVQNFGFELKSEGTLYTRTLDVEELIYLGVEEPVKLKQKMEQATNLVLLVKTRPAVGEKLDSLVPPQKSNGNGEFTPALDEINTPEELLKQLSAIFTKKTAPSNRAFILTVLDDSNYAESHILGHDMDPKNPGTVEVYSAKDGILLEGELAVLSRKILDSSFQQRVLIRPGSETRVPAKLVRRALGV